MPYRKSVGQDGETDWSRCVDVWVVGGGIGGYWGDIRSVGSKTSNGSESTGVIPFLKVVDAEMLANIQKSRDAWKKNAARRGFAFEAGASMPFVKDDTVGAPDRSAPSTFGAPRPKSKREIRKEAMAEAAASGLPDGWVEVTDDSGRAWAPKQQHATTQAACVCGVRVRCAVRCAVCGVRCAVCGEVCGARCAPRRDVGQ